MFATVFCSRHTPCAVVFVLECGSSLPLWYFLFPRSRFLRLRCTLYTTLLVCLDRVVLALFGSVSGGLLGLPNVVGDRRLVLGQRTF